jgi:predicted secreted hydrolase
MIFPFFFILFFISPPAFAQDFSCADPSYVYHFPRDHGSHPTFKIEWWYYTGVVKSEDGRTFGFQWTAFRNGLVPESGKKKTLEDFGSQQIFFAHAALSDVQNQKFYFAERRSRGFFDEAQASTEKLDVRVQDFSVMETQGAHQLKAHGNDFELSLQATPKKNLVFHGNKGVTQKDPGACQASHYLSYTRMAVSGQIGVGGETRRVTGEAWMDHEFSSSQLLKKTLGWDWFSLQLDNHEEIMLYFLRDAQGGILESSSGSLVRAGGGVEPLKKSDIEIRVLSRQVSGASQTEYPSQWQLEIPKYSLSLTLTSAFADQELTTEESTGISYYEGVIHALGKRHHTAVKGHGYVELTGYKK